MRSRVLFVLILVLVVGGLVVGAMVLRQQEGASPDSSTPAPETSPAALISPDPNASPGAMASPDPNASPAAVASNPNPDLTVDTNGLSKATVTLQTQYGPIRFKLYPNDAPNTVKRFIELVNQGFYNGLSFHRVVPGFVVQGGDPQGNGTGGSGQKLKAEFNERRHVEGTVAMARASDPDSADSQFYITLSPQPHLDRSYTIFGQVIEGMDAVRKLQIGDKMTSVSIQ